MTHKITLEDKGQDFTEMVIEDNDGNKKCMGFKSSNLSAYIELN